MPQENAPILPHLRTRLKPTVDTVDTVDKKAARDTSRTARTQKSTKLRMTLKAPFIFSTHLIFRPFPAQPILNVPSPRKSPQVLPIPPLSPLFPILTPIASFH